MTHTKESIKELATKVFGDRKKAEVWLSSPITALNDKTPISKLDSSKGIEEVRSILRKIESGEFM